jgi:hypothetical protein
VLDKISYHYLYLTKRVGLVQIRHILIEM